jgi:hypothetical protein
MFENTDLYKYKSGTFTSLCSPDDALIAWKNNYLRIPEQIGGTNFALGKFPT